MKLDEVIGVIGAGISTVIFAFALSGCGSTFSNHDFVMGGTENAWKTYHDAQLNAMKQMVEPKEVSNHLDRRKIEIQADTLQNEVGTTFWQKLVARAKARSEGEK